MLLRYFYDESLAQASYLVGCVKTGEALVIDPARDVEPYLVAAERAGLRITQVTETHIHADFVSGLRELAARTGATMYVSDMGDVAWKYAFAGEPNVIPVREGDRWMVGNVRVEVVHTPGHTPEHIAFMITDTAAADEPIGVFTGDFLFVGDVGRPDLLEAAAGVVGSKEQGARRQFHSVQRFKALPDYLQIWPGHGAGSACGKALGAIPSTTLGYEKRFNPAFRFTDEGEFVQWLLEGQPEPPKYFAQMKRVNKAGPALLSSLKQPQRLTPAHMRDVLAAGGQVFDLRYRPDFARAHLRGAISTPASSPSFSTYVGWFVDYRRPVYLILPDVEQLDAILKALRAIGVDDVAGYVGPEAIGDAAEALPVISARQLAERLPKNGLVVLDVRNKAEYDALHIRGAKHIPLGYLPDRLAEVPRDRDVVVTCATGYRSCVAASLLRSAGFDNVTSMPDGMETWARLLPTERSH
ncbi:MAG: MBL fold metallo-hydrolase [Thermoflexales bacterium]|nr:MBL fold metallo-hydrolase [Thermoflexales bacterium]MDW8351990.1 MBL fold metallo-hydrolase [Anaerolineae bacterium]